MKIQPTFPLCYREDPMRRAEQTIYKILEESEAPGRALYEARVLPHGRQIDFAIWLENIGRYAVEVKGGRYVIEPETGEWYLLTDGGRYRKESPAAQAWTAAKSVPEIIKLRLHRGVYIIAVVAFPNMARDQAIADAAARNHVDVIFGTDRWVNQLVELAGPHHIIVPPTEEQIEEEVPVIMPELAVPAAAAPGPQVVIQHVNEVHFHVGPEGVEGLGGLTDAG